MNTLTCIAALTVLNTCAPGATLIDMMSYWRPGGQTVSDPVGLPPADALVSVRQTLFDDAEGRQILNQKLTDGEISGVGGIPADPPIHVLRYTITNLTYGNGSGAGIGGLRAPRAISQIYGLFAPTAAADRWGVTDWDPAPGGWTYSSWYTDANANGSRGDGTGILLNQSSADFYVVTNAYDQVGFFMRAEIYGWSGGGLLEQPAASETSVISGELIVPLPAPSTGAVFLLAAAPLRRCRR